MSDREELTELTRKYVAGLLRDWVLKDALNTPEKRAEVAEFLAGVLRDMEAPRRCEVTDAKVSEDGHFTCTVRYVDFGLRIALEEPTR